MDCTVTEWRRIGYLVDRLNEQSFSYYLNLPEPLASWDVYQYWERQQVESMQEHLKPGMRLFDIGAETGWQSAVYAQIVGGENMTLVEPSQSFWPLIRQIWKHNDLAMPEACVVALAGNKTRDAMIDWDWPAISNNGLSTGYRDYRYLHVDDLPIVTIDALAAAVGSPDALTVDVEGAELEVLRGAESTLRRAKPLVWVSASPDLSVKNYGTTLEEMIDFVQSCGYKADRISVDHEQHHLFTPVVKA